LDQGFVASLGVSTIEKELSCRSNARHEQCNWTEKDLWTFGNDRKLVSLRFDGSHSEATRTVWPV